MPNQIQEWALEHFYESQEVSFSLPNADFYEVEAFVSGLSFEGSEWSHDSVGFSYYKVYDEDGNGDTEGVLLIDTRGKSLSDVLELAEMFDGFYPCEDEYMFEGEEVG